jgi:hypothetical protein
VHRDHRRDFDFPGRGQRVFGHASKL